ncbi:MAG: hypothetical protein KDD70_02995 [Bdellovibrionales bacterium]|nr:hypothetical protein [Bdellovibrionales bacterium]
MGTLRAISSARGQIATKGPLALKVVERPRYYEGELCSPDELYGVPAHSLHQLCPLPFEIHPAAISAVIHSLTKREDTVLDPFCGSGAVGLEAGLSERDFILSDIDPVALTVAAAKVRPSDLTEVALWLQMSPLSTPASFDGFEEVFSHFYAAETFRELSALRRLLSTRKDRLSHFLRGLSLGLLHGRGAGSFSVYSPAERALSVDRQRELNEKRNHFPDYRAIAPRLLRKSAVTLQDGIPSILFKREQRTRIALSDPRELGHVKTGTVDLVLTNPPIPRHRVVKGGNWLRSWFIGTKGQDRFLEFVNPSSWENRMNEVLVESARVCRPAGRMALFCDRRFLNASEVSGVRDRLLRVVEGELSYYWEPECFLSMPQQKVSITGRKQADGMMRLKSDPEGVLVLRRK